MPPTSIGPFEVIGSLGAGPRGSVYRARRVDHGRIVAIKQLSAVLPPDSPEFTRLWNEVARLRAVVSNHVATTYSVELIDGRPVIEMESLGESLEKATSTQPLGLREALHAVRDILAGLKVLHDAGIGHGNLKPSNVLQDTTTGSWKLSDGGTTPIETQTTPTLLATSVLYAAPELLLEQAEAGERSDLYSVGMMGLEAVLGAEGLRAAFPKVSNLHSPGRWLTWLEDPTQEALPLHKVRAETPERVSNFFARLLAKNQDGRFASAFAATVELEAILPQLTSTSSEMPTYSAVSDPPTLLVGTPEGSKARLLITGPNGFDQQLELSDRTYRIGRDTQNDIVLPDETKAVSRIHAELRHEGERYVLTDLDSQNGLWVNGRRKPTVQLQHGVSVKIGGYTVTFSAAAVAAETNQTPAPAKPAPVKTKPAQTPEQTGGARVAMNGVTATGSRFGSTVRAWWPPKNAQQWAAVVAIPALIVAAVLWVAFRGSSSPPPDQVEATGVGGTQTPTSTPTPTEAPVSAKDNSIKQIRDMLDQKKHADALREIETLLLLEPQDSVLLALKQEATAGIPPTPQASNTPTLAPTGVSPNKPATGQSPRGRQAGGSTAGQHQPRIPRLPNETDAAWIERDKRLSGQLDRALAEPDPRTALGLLTAIGKEEPAFPNIEAHIKSARGRLNQQVQGAIQEGQSAEADKDLPRALAAYERARELELTPGEGQAHFNRVRAEMTRQGEQAYKDASVSQLNNPERTRQLLRTAIAYLPDGHATKKLAQDALKRMGG